MKRKKSHDPQFTDTQERDIKAIESWCESHGKQFLESAEAQKLTPLEQQECLNILQNFSLFCYLYHSEKPGEWTIATVKDVCSYQLPKKMIVEVDVIMAIAPVLTVFLKWGENQKILTNTSPLQKAIQSVKKQIIENANDFENWDKSKIIFIGAKRQGIDITNEDEMIHYVSKLSRLFKFAEMLEEGNRPYPKQASEIHTPDDIVEDVEYLLSAYPEAAVKKALTRQEEMTPLLLDMMKDAVSRYQHLHHEYWGHIYALFILAKFREQQAFPLAIQLISLPDNWPEEMLGDIITEDLHQILGSVYDGNLESLKNLIENPNAYIWSRGAGLSTLLVLVKANVLERDFVINYLKTLFPHPAFINDDLAMALLIDVATQLYPAELYDEIKDAYQKKKVDLDFIEKRDVDFVLEMGKENALKKNFYNNPGYDLIHDPVKKMEGWAYAEDEEEEDFDERDDLDYKAPFKRETPKVGRNDPCPCGSGKKFKKCCGLG